MEIEKRDCAWGCARGINTTWENLQIEKHKSGGVRFAHRTDLCFSIWRFSQMVFIPERNLTHNLFFLFPIVFGINTSMCDTALAMRKFIADESSQMLEYKIFTRTKISVVADDQLTMQFLCLISLKLVLSFPQGHYLPLYNKLLCRWSASRHFQWHHNNGPFCQFSIKICNFWLNYEV